MSTMTTKQTVLELMTMTLLTTIYGACATAALLGTLGNCASAAVQTPQPIQLASKLVDPHGTPVSDASAVLETVNSKSNTVTTTNYKSDSSGKVVLTLAPDQLASAHPVFYVISPTGFGLLDLGNAPAPGALSPSTLVPFTSLTVQVLDNNGFPVAHVKVCPRSLNNQTLYGIAGDPNLADWVQTTDAYGYATIPRLPQGFKLQLSILDNQCVPAAPDAYIQLGSTAATTHAELRVLDGYGHQIAAPYQEAMATGHRPG